MRSENKAAFKKKWENYWYHYKFITWIGIIIVAVVIFLTANVLQKRNPDMVLAYVSTEYGDESQLARCEDAFKSIVGDLNGDGRVLLNYRMMTVRKQDITTWDVDKEQQMNYSFIDKNVRLYIIAREFAEQKKDFFLPLDDLLPADALLNGLSSDEGIYAIPLKGNALANEMNFEEYYIGVKKIISTELNDQLVERQHEKAKEILQYIVKEGNV